MKDVGLVGSPGSGRSTLFTALTRAGSAGGRETQAMVAVSDPRLEVLARLEGSRELVPARVRFTDVPGALTAQGLARLREADALCVVIRAFGPAADPTRELSQVTDELLLADLSLAEAALEGARRGLKGRPRGESSEDVDLLVRAHAALTGGGALRDLDLDERERKVLRGWGPLSLKPWVVVANLEEGTALPSGLPEGTIGVWAEMEAETSDMAPEEASALLAEFAVTEPGVERVVVACYRALDLITFLTFNEQEARAWEVPRGATAPEAAGVIHSDLQRGFIRAEVVSFDELVAAGGWDAARARGSMRVEGKEYVVREGDVIRVRFAV
jgi:ribosome-binding ATPase YchF (GTP1/OBG family)